MECHVFSKSLIRARFQNGNTLPDNETFRVAEISAIFFFSNIFRVYGGKCFELFVYESLIFLTCAKNGSEWNFFSGIWNGFCSYIFQILIGWYKKISIDNYKNFLNKKKIKTQKEFPLKCRTQIFLKRCSVPKTHLINFRSLEKTQLSRSFVKSCELYWKFYEWHRSIGTFIILLWFNLIRVGKTLTTNQRVGFLEIYRSFCFDWRIVSSCWMMVVNRRFAS